MLKPILKTLTLLCLITSYATHRYAENNQRSEYTEIIKSECERLEDQIIRYPESIRDQSKKSKESYALYQALLKDLTRIYTSSTAPETQAIHTYLNYKYQACLSDEGWRKITRFTRYHIFFCANRYKLELLIALSEYLSPDTLHYYPPPKLIIKGTKVINDKEMIVRFQSVHFLDTLYSDIKIQDRGQDLSITELPFYYPKPLDSLKLCYTNPHTKEKSCRYVEP